MTPRDRQNHSVTMSHRTAFHRMWFTTENVSSLEQALCVVEDFECVTGGPSEARNSWSLFSPQKKDVKVFRCIFLEEETLDEFGSP